MGKSGWNWNIYFAPSQKAGRSIGSFVDLKRKKKGGKGKSKSCVGARDDRTNLYIIRQLLLLTNLPDVSESITVHDTIGTISSVSISIFKILTSRRRQLQKQLFVIQGGCCLHAVSLIPSTGWLACTVVVVCTQSTLVLSDHLKWLPEREIQLITIFVFSLNVTVHDSIKIIPRESEKELFFQGEMKLSTLVTFTALKI